MPLLARRDTMYWSLIQRPINHRRGIKTFTREYEIEPWPRRRSPDDGETYILQKSQCRLIRAVASRGHTDMKSQCGVDYKARCREFSHIVMQTVPPGSSMELHAIAQHVIAPTQHNPPERVTADVTEYIRPATSGVTSEKMIQCGIGAYIRKYIMPLCRAEV